MVKPVTFQGQFNFNANLYALEVKSRFIDQSKADGYYTGYGNELNAQIVGGNTIQIGTGAFIVQGRMCEITEAETVRPQLLNGFKGYVIARIETYHPADEDNCSIIAKIQTSFETLNAELEQSDVYAKTADNINTAYELPIYSFEISGTRIVNLTKLIKPVRDYATIKTIVDNALAQAEAAVQQANAAVSTANTANGKSDNAVATANAAQTAAGQAVSTANTANGKSDNAVATANAASAAANTANEVANAADAKSDRAISASQRASGKANNAVELAEQSAAFAARAVNAAEQAVETSDEAVSTSQDAQTAAGNAVATANQAASDASTALGVANALDGKITTANTTASAAVETAGQAVSTANATQTHVNEALSAQDEEIAELAEQIAQGQGTRVTIGGVLQNTFAADEYTPAEAEHAEGADAAKITSFAVYSQEAERAAGYTRGGEIDREIKALKARLSALENN